MSDRARKGLSLVEVTVILAVLMLTAVLTLPALHAAQIFARRVQCVNSLKQLGLASHNYHDVYGTLPMSRTDTPFGRRAGHGIGHSGFTALLPFLEQTALYNTYNFSLENWHIANSTSTRTQVVTFLCADNENPTQPLKAADIPTLDGKGYPGANLFARNHYGFNWGGGHDGFGDGFLKQKGRYLGLVMTVVTEEGQKAGAKSIRFSDVRDGLSNTVLIVEKRDGAGWAVGGFAGSEFDVNTTSAYVGDDPKTAKVFTGSFHEVGPNTLMSRRLRPLPLPQGRDEGLVRPHDPRRRRGDPIGGPEPLSRFRAFPVRPRTIPDCPPRYNVRVNWVGEGRVIGAWRRRIPSNRTATRNGSIRFAGPSSPGMTRGIATFPGVATATPTGSSSPR